MVEDIVERISLEQEKMRISRVVDCLQQRKEKNSVAAKSCLF